MTMNTDYQHALLLALRLNIALNKVSTVLRLEETPGHRLMETLAYINNTGDKVHDHWKDIVVAPAFGGNGSGAIPEWNEATVIIRLTGPSEQVYELSVTTRGEGYASLNSIQVETDGVFPRNGKLLLLAQQKGGSYVVKFHPKNADREKGHLHELGRFIDIAVTLATFDEPSRDLFNIMTTALSPY